MSNVLKHRLPIFFLITNFDNFLKHYTSLIHKQSLSGNLTANLKCFLFLIIYVLEFEHNFSLFS